MTSRVALSHRTEYRYDRPVALSAHEIRLCPRPHGRAVIERYALTITPHCEHLRWHEDAYGNWIAQTHFAERLTELALDVSVVVRLPQVNPFDFLVADHAVAFPFDYSDDERRGLAPFLERDDGGEAVDAWIGRLRRDLLQAPIATVDFLVEVNRMVAEDVRYERRPEPGVHTPAQTLAAKSGSCRDSTWLLAQTLRRFGLATRFVSGYLVQLATDETKRDSLDLHAWCEAYVPGAGWIGLDSTSGLATAEGHIALAVGAEPAATSPVLGYADAKNSKLSFEMSVTRLGEDEKAASVV